MRLLFNNFMRCLVVSAFLMLLAPFAVNAFDQDGSNDTNTGDSYWDKQDNYIYESTKISEPGLSQRHPFTVYIKEEGPSDCGSERDKICRYSYVQDSFNFCGYSITGTTAYFLHEKSYLDLKPGIKSHKPRQGSILIHSVPADSCEFINRQLDYLGKTSLDDAVGDLIKLAEARQTFTTKDLCGSTVDFAIYNAVKTKGYVDFEGGCALLNRQVSKPYKLTDVEDIPDVDDYIKTATRTTCGEEVTYEAYFHLRDTKGYFGTSAPLSCDILQYFVRAGVDPLFIPPYSEMMSTKTICTVYGGFSVTLFENLNILFEKGYGGRPSACAYLTWQIVDDSVAPLNVMNYVDYHNLMIEQARALEEEEAAQRQMIVNELIQKQENDAPFVPKRIVNLQNLDTVNFNRAQGTLVIPGNSITQAMHHTPTTPASMNMQAVLKNAASDDPAETLNMAVGSALDLLEDDIRLIAQQLSNLTDCGPNRFWNGSDCINEQDPLTLEPGRRPAPQCDSTEVLHWNPTAEDWECRTELFEHTVEYDCSNISRLPEAVREEVEHVCKNMGFLLDFTDPTTNCESLFPYKDKEETYKQKGVRIRKNCIDR